MYDNVIFSAYKNETDGTYISAGNYLEKFNGYLTNFGNGFLLPNGTFTAPRIGTYEFSIAAHSYSSNVAQLTVEHNGADVLSFFTRGSSYNTLSFSWIMELQQEDTVKFKVTSGNIYCHTSYDCIFSGKLIKN